MLDGPILTHPAGQPREPVTGTADPITVEVVRHALNSAANQMKRALIRPAFSPVIYEVLDFAVAIYDSHLRMLAQAPSLPLFMGTLNYAVDEAVKGVGGPDALDPGDVLIYNWSYGTGSHAQDVVIIMPAFHHGALIGYTAIKGHWLDIAAKEPYCTDTVDIFQEGTVYPGLKLYRKGVLNEDVYRIILANTRVPKAVAGDLDAQIAGCRVGVNRFQEVVDRFGLEKYGAAVEEMFDHGDRVIRAYFEKIPDGRYVGTGRMDSDGVGSGPVPFEIALEVSGSDVTIDFSKAPEQQRGPINCPLPSTMSASRVAITMLAGYGEPPHEGHFRPINVKTREGTMFHPVSPAPCFIYGWPALQAIEIIYRALAEAMPGAVPASSGGCICSGVWWGIHPKDGNPWMDGAPHPVGQGAWEGGDGGTMLHIAESATRFTPVEVWETRNPWVVEHMQLAPDSGGPGKWRGGAGIDFRFRMLADTY
ncbi:MAG: hydantoinase B/oxoprolinase family protein, partial [Alphaproteobacteria bacterium]|nr:hydantoinase B/oxoprolinase family protein [Alphaproteobacteria bacterium]